LQITKQCIWVLTLVIVSDAFAGEQGASCFLMEQQKWQYSDNAPRSPQSEYSYVHSSLRDLMNLPASLIKATITAEGYAPRGNSITFGTMAWIRDHYPVWGHFKDGDRTNTGMLRYTSPYSERAFPNSGPANYAPVSPPAGAPKDAVLVRQGNESLFVGQREFPGFLEGGNFQWTTNSDRPYVFTSNKTVELNRYVSTETLPQLYQQIAERLNGTGIAADKWMREFKQGLTERGITLPVREQTREDVIKTMSKATTVPEDRIIITEWMPGERSGHVDMWLGVLRGNLLAVPYIPPTLINKLGFAHEREFSFGINAWLDKQVEQLSSLPDVRIVRLPMLPPKNLKPSSQSPLGYDATFLSTVNFVTQGDRVIIGEHEGWMSKLEPADREQLRDEIKTKLADFGMETDFVAADQVLDKGGGLHCVTADYPDFSPTNH